MSGKKLLLKHALIHDVANDATLHTFKNKHPTTLQRESSGNHLYLHNDILGA